MVPDTASLVHIHIDFYVQILSVFLLACHRSHLIVIAKLLLEYHTSKSYLFQQPLRLMVVVMTNRSLREKPARYLSR